MLGPDDRAPVNSVPADGEVEDYLVGLVVNSAGDIGDLVPGDGLCYTGEFVMRSPGSIEPRCTLRAAIIETNATVDIKETIDFDIPENDPGFDSDNGTFTIAPPIKLPAITDPVILDATTQPDYLRDPLIVLTGADMATSEDEAPQGLLITAGSSTVRGFAINAFLGSVFGDPAGNGIRLQLGGGNIIEKNRIGTDATGTSKKPNWTGILVYSSSANTVRGNLLSGNTEQGAEIPGDADGNVLTGNFIGTDKSGMSPLGNGVGVEIAQNARNNRIGGEKLRTTFAPDNLISGNGIGVLVSRSAVLGVTRDNRIEGNFIGTDVHGQAPLANRVGASVGGSGNTVGGEAPLFAEGVISASGNLISGNTETGLDLGGNSRALGNLIGVNVDGTRALGNGGNGVKIAGSGIVVGGKKREARNVISANGQHGVYILGSSGSVIEGNFVGTDVSGMVDLGNVDTGIVLQLVSGPNTIGGTGLASRNVISGNGADGVRIHQANTKQVVQGNLIGLDATGGAQLGNDENGITIIRGEDIIVGGDTSQSGTAPGNVISGNKGHGVELLLSKRVMLSGNFIGTDEGGTRDLGNERVGVRVSDSDDNFIGGNNAGKGRLVAGNLISGNQQQGILIRSGSSGNRVAGNYIGLNKDGDIPLANGDPDEIPPDDGGGGTRPREESPDEAQAAVFPEDPRFNKFDGIFIQDSPGNIVGHKLEDSGSDFRNIISANLGHGVRISGEVSDGSFVVGNYIGTDKTGMRVETPEGGTSLGNLGNGVTIVNAPNTRINDISTDPGTVIAGNRGAGVLIEGSQATGNRIERSLVGVNLNADEALPNKRWGIVIRDAPNNHIGGEPGRAISNVVSGHAGAGIGILGAAAQNNELHRNIVGLNSAGDDKISNRWGVVIRDAPNNVVGAGYDPDNIISGNTVDGVLIHGISATANSVSGNLIGTNANSDPALGNGTGVRIWGAPGNIIGDLVEAGRYSNVISGNELGVRIRNDEVDDEVVEASGNEIAGNLIGTNAAGTAALPNTLDGISLAAPGTKIGGQNLGNVISGNTGAGIRLEENGVDTAIQGNRIGTTKDGMSALGNSTGVLAENSGGHLIGGAGGPEGHDKFRNIISGNRGDGIFLSGTRSVNVENNFIGPAVDGETPLGNAGEGVHLTSSNCEHESIRNVIGGETEGHRNLISASGKNGVHISRCSADNQIVGNLIQDNQLNGVLLDASGEGQAAIGFSVDDSQAGNPPGNVIRNNGRNGIYVKSALAIGIRGNSVSGHHDSVEMVDGQDVTHVGVGVRVGDAFEIAIRENSIFHNTVGVLMDSESGGDISVWKNSISHNNVGIVTESTDGWSRYTRNSIENNNGLGIDLGNDGVTLNDPLDADAGANLRQNFPLLRDAVALDTGTIVTGVINSLPLTPFRVELFDNNAADPSGYGEGATFVAERDVVTDENGNAFFAVAGLGIPVGRIITATATRLAGAGSFGLETSEFSPGIAVVEAIPLDFGDAPSGTTLADNGAFHVIAGGLQLGSTVDAEADGRPHGEANGDDQDGSDDEDGVTIPARIARWTTFEVPVDVVGSGRLDAWIDFNRDGIWDNAPGSTERIYSSEVTAGTTVVTATAPGSAVIGPTFARFRLSRTDAPLPPTGPGGDGEVEDYRVLLTSWQNPAIPEDVNDDGFVVAIDALIIINSLNARPEPAEGEDLTLLG